MQLAMGWIEPDFCLVLAHLLLFLSPNIPVTRFFFQQPEGSISSTSQISNQKSNILISPLRGALLMPKFSNPNIPICQVIFSKRRQTKQFFVFPISGTSVFLFLVPVCSDLFHSEMLWIPNFDFDLLYGFHVFCGALFHKFLMLQRLELFLDVCNFKFL